MTEIKVLGTGCPSCKTTEKIVEEVIAEIGLNAKVVKVTDIQEIMEYNVMSTPAVVVNEKVVLKGKVPSKDEVKKALTANCCTDNSSCCTPEEKESGCC